MRGCEKKKKEEEWKIETKKEPLIGVKLNLSFLSSRAFLSVIRSGNSNSAT